MVEVRMKKTWSLLQKIQSFLVGCKESFLIIKKYYTLKPKQITKTLSKFYTNSRKKRTDTRKKNRPEFEIIVDEIRRWEWRNKKKKLFIVELGCGDGRFAMYLDQHLQRDFTYVGIDCSVGLIDLAKTNDFRNSVEFFVGDMINYLQFLEQQSVDMIISIASLQHLHYKQRQQLWNQTYRVLEYGWVHITINWSYSIRFFRKYVAMLIAWMVLGIVNHKTFGRHDLMIPFKDTQEEGLRPLYSEGRYRAHSTKTKVTYRFYHIYLLGSLIHYAYTSWFVVDQAKYVSRVWELSDSWSDSRNTFLTAKKDVS